MAKRLKILNLYAGIGGNRKLWGDEYEITAVEWDENIAKIYQDFFPEDTVIIADAHQYLLDHYKEFDIIWSSPPCPTHSRIGKANTKRKVKYPDMRLYEEILLLQGYFKGNWIVENVMSWYEPLIEPQVLQRHYFWSNKNLGQRRFATEKTCSTKDRERLTKLFGINIDKYTGIDKRKCLRNCVLPELGEYILSKLLKE
jgi:DNA (cytosine-5)-methyltransferase 1